MSAFSLASRGNWSPTLKCTPIMDAQLRLRALNSKLFTLDALDLLFMHVPRFQCGGKPEAQGATTRIIESMPHLRECLAFEDSNTRGQSIIILHQLHSWSRVQLPAAAFALILTSFQSSTVLQEITTAFGIKTSEDERRFEGMRSCSLSSRCSNRIHETGYVIPHVDRHGRDLKDPWSVRHIGVYHQTISSEKSRWIFIGLKTVVERELSSVLETGSEKSYYTTHARLLARLSQSWIDYIEYLSLELSQYNNKATYALEPGHNRSAHTVSSADLQELHILEAKIKRADAAIQTCLTISQGCTSHFCNHEAAARNYEEDGTERVTTTGSTETTLLLFRHQEHMRNLLLSLSQLKARFESTLRLLTNILICHNSTLLQTSNSASTHMLQALVEIASQTRHQQETLTTLLSTSQADSSMLKGLSVVATVCLPASLVATIFSSNLITSVDVDDASPATRLVCSTQFWIYIAITVPLMGATLVWILRWDRQARAVANKAQKMIT